MQKTNTKKLALNSLFLAIGLILHQIMPVFGLPMEPDMALATLFIIILMNRDNFLTCLNAGVITGVFTALTTKFPGGQFPNVIDKISTSIIVFILIWMIYNLPIIRKLKESVKELLIILIVFPVGTFISGVIFLASASYIVGLPASVSALVMTVVLPAMVLNTIAGVFLVKIINKVLEYKSL